MSERRCNRRQLFQSTAFFTQNSTEQRLLSDAIAGCVLLGLSFCGGQSPHNPVIPNRYSGYLIGIPGIVVWNTGGWMQQTVFMVVVLT
jgi:hypothetical protein